MQWKLARELSLIDRASWSAAIALTHPSVAIRRWVGITMARLALHFPTYCNEYLILPGERHGLVLVGFQARGCGPCLRQRHRLGISGGPILYILDLQPVRSHPGQKWLELRPASGYDTQALDYRIKNCEFAHIVRPISGTHSILREHELDDDCGYYTRCYEMNKLEYNMPKYICEVLTVFVERRCLRKSCAGPMIVWRALRSSPGQWSIIRCRYWIYRWNSAMLASVQ